MRNAIPHREVLGLAAIACVCALAIAASTGPLAAQIEANRLAFEQRALRDIYPAAAAFDSTESGYVALDETRTVIGRLYRGRTLAAYNGLLELLVGVSNDNRVTGVRVMRHRETPGLGDFIEADRSPWILQFTGQSRNDVGTAVDGRSGATVTTRAVQLALADALLGDGS